METHCQRQASPRALQRLPTTEVFFDVLSLQIVRAMCCLWGRSSLHISQSFDRWLFLLRVLLSLKQLWLFRIKKMYVDPTSWKPRFQRDLGICIILVFRTFSDTWHMTYDKYPVSKYCSIYEVNYFIDKVSYLFMLPHTSKIIVCQFLIKVEHKIKPLNHWTKEVWNENPRVIVFGYLFTHLSINLPI